MIPTNACTININCVKYNGQLHFDQRIHNKSAIVLDHDTWDEFGEMLIIYLISHMHRIHFYEIQKDRYGDREDLKKRFGTKSWIKICTCTYSISFIHRLSY
jgi:hypothetical protein